MSNTSPSLELAPVWVVIPAAGVGARMGGGIPKQYLPLANKTVLQTTLDKMLALPALAGIVVAVGPDDHHWHEHKGTYEPSLVYSVIGGKERADSVLNALQYLKNQHVRPEHWVLVHDAARPCVDLQMIQRLRERVEQCSARDEVKGGLLAKPVADTLKRVRGQSIEATCDRSELWQAHTPQMFRLGDLQSALEAAAREGLTVTDEASAIEQAGLQVIVVEDRRDNLKVTHPEDLPLAETILLQQIAREDAL